MARIVVLDKESWRHEHYRQCLLEHDLLIVRDVGKAVKTVVDSNPLPDLVLADWLSGGPSVIEKLKILAERNPGYQPPPVILMDDILDSEKYELMAQAAHDQGAAEFLPRQLSRELFVGRISGFLVQDIPTQQLEEVDEDMGDSPYAIIAQLAGGWTVFDNILEKSGVRTSEVEMHRLRKVIADWASLPLEEILREAADYYSCFAQNRLTKLASVLYHISDAILFQHGPVGADESKY